MHVRVPTIARATLRPDWLDSTQLEEVVASFVNGFLTPLFKTNKLAKEDFKWVSRKAVNKVLEGSRGKPADGFMSTEREAKIRKLVEGYIKARKRGAT